MTAALLDAPLASEVVFLTLPRLPEAGERPAWVEYEDRSDDRPTDGSAGIFWRRIVSTNYGDMMVEQWVWLVDGRVCISRAYWDSANYEFELTSAECQAMAEALWKLGRVVEAMDRDTLAFAASLGDPWVTTTEAAKRLNTTSRDVRERVDAGDLTAVKVGSLTYVRAADL